MGKYYLDLRHRAKVDEPVKEKHGSFMTVMANVDQPWGYNNKPVPDVIVEDSELVSVVELRELSSRGLKSYITYPLRNDQYLRDEAQYDDNIIIEFKPKETDLSDFVNNIFPIYIEAFDCYRSSVINREVSRGDWPSIVELTNSTGKNIDGRDGVYRINEINYYDRELCRRAFNLTPEEIVQRLDGKVERVSVFHDGVLLIYSSKLLPQDGLEKIDSEIKTLLK